MLHISHVTALFKNDKETAEKYIRKLQDELLITTDTGKQYFSSFCVAIYPKMNSIVHWYELSFISRFFYQSDKHAANKLPKLFTVTPCNSFRPFKRLHLLLRIL